MIFLIFLIFSVYVLACAMLMDVIFILYTQRAYDDLAELQLTEL